MPLWQTQDFTNLALVAVLLLSLVVCGSVIRFLLDAPVLGSYPQALIREWRDKSKRRQQKFAIVKCYVFGLLVLVALVCVGLLYCLSNLQFSVYPNLAQWYLLNIDTTLSPKESNKLTVTTLSTFVLGINRIELNVTQQPITDGILDDFDDTSEAVNYSLYPLPKQCQGWRLPWRNCHIEHSAIVYVENFGLCSRRGAFWHESRRNRPSLFQLKDKDQCSQCHDSEKQHQRKCKNFGGSIDSSRHFVLAAIHCGQGPPVHIQGRVDLSRPVFGGTALDVGVLIFALTWMVLLLQVDKNIRVEYCLQQKARKAILSRYDPQLTTSLQMMGTQIQAEIICEVIRQKTQKLCQEHMKATRPQQSIVISKRLTRRVQRDLEQIHADPPYPV